MALPGLCDLIMDEGAAFDQDIVWYDENGDLVDNTGYTAKAEVRKNKEDASPVLTFQTSDSTITLGGSDGTFTLTQTAAVMRALDFDRGFWSLEVSPGGTADLNAATDNKCLLKGIVVLNRETTK